MLVPDPIPCMSWIIRRMTEETLDGSEWRLLEVLHRSGAKEPPLACLK